MNIQDLPIEIKEHIGKVQKITFPKQGHTSTVAILDTFDQKYIIKKTENDLYNEWLSDEYQVLQSLYRTGLPVPKVYSFHMEETSRWLLMDYIDGISLREFLSTMPVDNERDKEIFYNGYGKLRITDEEYYYFEDGIYNFF